MQEEEAVRDVIIKNGIDNMTVKVLMKCSHHDLDENETLYITGLDTLHPRGYNLRCGSKAAAHKPDFKVSQHIIDVDEDVKDAVLDDIADVSGIDRTSLSWGGPITVTLRELNHIPLHGILKLHTAETVLPTRTVYGCYGVRVTHVTFVSRT